MELLLATHNQHKADEMRSMLEEDITLLTLADVGYNEDIEESGSTFKENAAIKAKAAYNATGIKTLADDSGLCVSSLDNAPGIYSARYAGTGNSKDNIQKLLFALEAEKNRDAHFNATLCLYDGKEEHFFEGIINGEIIEEIQGEDGFGYDPIFKPKGYNMTFAEMPSDVKNKISHRALAIQKFIQFFNKY